MNDVYVRTLIVLISQPPCDFLKSFADQLLIVLLGVPVSEEVNTFVLHEIMNML
jgi:hypothetical protein